MSMKDVTAPISGGMKAKVAFFWLLALAPLSWGVYQTAMKVMAMFA